MDTRHSTLAITMALNGEPARILAVAAGVIACEVKSTVTMVDALPSPTLAWSVAEGCMATSSSLAVPELRPKQITRIPQQRRPIRIHESGPKARPTGVVEWMNGSIFPYRHATDKTESASTNLRVRAYVSFGSRMPWPVGTVKSTVSIGSMMTTGILRDFNKDFA